MKKSNIEYDSTESLLRNLTRKQYVFEDGILHVFGVLIFYILIFMVVSMIS